MVTETTGRMRSLRERMKRAEERRGPRSQRLMATESNNRSWQMKSRRGERQVTNWRVQGHTSKKENVSRKKQSSELSKNEN